MAGPTIRSGPTVHAKRDTGYYPTGIKMTKAELSAVPLTDHNFHPEWNYTIGPGPKNPKPVITGKLFPGCPYALNRMFSIIIPTYNPNEWLSFLVQGCLACPKVYEVILSDDCSQQRQWVDRCREFSDRVIVIDSRENRGAASARALGASAASAKYLAFIDQDDLVTADHFDVASVLHERADLVISSGWKLSDRRMSPLYLRRQLDLSLSRIEQICWIMSPGQVTVTAQVYSEVGGFDPYCQRGVDDYDLWLRLFRSNVSRTWSGKRTFVWREHSHNTSSTLPMGALATNIRSHYNVDSSIGLRKIPGRSCAARLLRHGQSIRSDRLQWTTLGWQILR